MYILTTSIVLPSVSSSMMIVAQVQALVSFGAIWWTQFLNDVNVLAQHVASTAGDLTEVLPRHFSNCFELHKYKVANKRHVHISGKHFAWSLTERDQESSRLRASASNL